ncbi:MAG: aldehyde dehydrogenase family protein, partial [Candidatus Cloacimonetes bacterium]|nr:aldehyde dehydrogenase family protein [Candidatus Cloacimonadota bacterium]
MIINNKKVDSKNKFGVINPYTKEIVDVVSIASPKQVGNALELSYDYKCELSSAEKGGILRRTAVAIEKNKDDLATLITSESGICIKHSLYEVQRAINCLNYAVIEAESIDKRDLSSEFIINTDSSMP